MSATMSLVNNFDLETVLKDWINVNEAEHSLVLVNYSHLRALTRVPAVYVTLNLK